MDTNQLTILVHELAARQADVYRWEIIIPAIVIFLTSAAGYLKTKSAENYSKKAAVSSEAAAATGDNTKKEVDKIVTAVNGGYGAMTTELKHREEEIKRLNDKILNLERDKATLEEHQRAQGEASKKEAAKKEAIAEVTAAKVEELQTEIAKTKSP